MKPITTACLALLLTLAHKLDASDRGAVEIAHLIQFVSSAGCEFERNGNRHSAAEAKAHISRKHQHFQDEIDSAERFIHLAASRSSFTGRKYTIHCPGEKVMASETWLLQELKTLRANQQ